MPRPSLHDRLTTPSPYALYTPGPITTHPHPHHMRFTVCKTSPTRLSPAHANVAPLCIMQAPTRSGTAICYSAASCASPACDRAGCCSST